MSKERWKLVTNFKNVMNGMYEVSDTGKVRFFRTKELLHLKIANKKYHPYRAAYMKYKNGKSEWVLVHQLVATFFVPIPDDLKHRTDLVPDHLDNDGLNNHYTNLEWKTRGQNISDAFKMGYCDNSGERHRGTFITEEQAHQICIYLSHYYSYDEILNILGFPNTKKYRTLLVRIKNGLAWKRVASSYNINSKIPQYTKAQRDTIKKLPRIDKLLKEGKSALEVAQDVYKDDISVSRINTVRRIHKRELFKELLDEDGNYTKLIII